MVKIPQAIYRAFWLLTSPSAGKRDEDVKHLMLIAGLLLVLLGAATHTTG